MRRPLLRALALALAVWVAAPVVAQQRTVVHGENSVFRTGDVTLAWGVLRAVPEEQTEVVIRLVAPRHATVRVEAVDPFAGTRRPVAGPLPLGGGIEIRRRRADFADLPRLEIHLDPAPGGGAPLTIYYLGVPDTTPELTSVEALRRYLVEAVEKARRAP